MKCFEQELGIVDLNLSESVWISKLVDYYIKKNKGKKKRRVNLNGNKNTNPLPILPERD